MCVYVYVCKGGGACFIIWKKGIRRIVEIFVYAGPSHIIFSLIFPRPSDRQEKLAEIYFTIQLSHPSTSSTTSSSSSSSVYKTNFSHGFSFCLEATLRDFRWMISLFCYNLSIHFRGITVHLLPILSLSLSLKLAMANEWQIPGVPCDEIYCVYSLDGT